MNVHQNNKMRLCRTTRTLHPKSEMIKVEGRWYSKGTNVYQQAKASATETDTPVEVTVDELHKNHTDKIKESRLKIDNKILSEEVHRLREILGVKNEVEKELDGFSGYFFPNPVSSCTSLVTPYAMLSDVHPGKRVKRIQTNGLNEFSLAIAEERLQRYFRHLRKLLEIHNREVEFDRVVLALNGDMIENRFLHPGEAPSTDVSVVQEIVFMHQILSAGISDLARDWNIEVACVTGNHGRNLSHKRTPASLRVEESMEWLLYLQLKETLKTNNNVIFNIATGAHLITSAGDFNVMHTHGDGFSYMGGVGGLTIPLNKFISRMRVGLDVDYTIVGHYHQYLPSNNFVANGCFVAGSLVTMGDGTLKPIEDIIVGDVVLTKGGTNNRVNHVMPQTPNYDHLIEFCPNTNIRRAIRCTPNHNIWAVKGSKLASSEAQSVVTGEWIPAGYLSVGDYVRLSSLNQGTLDLDRDIAFMIGLFLAGGSTSCTRNGNRSVQTTFTFHIDETHLEEAAIRGLRKLFPYVYYNVSICPEKTIREVILSKTEVKEWFEDHCSKKSYDKHLKSDFYNSLTNESKFMIAAGWLAGDAVMSVASGERSETLTGSTTSHKLASQMENILLSNGIPAHNTTQHPSHSSHRTIYHLNIRGEYVNALSPLTDGQNGDHVVPKNKKTISNFRVLSDGIYVRLGHVAAIYDVPKTVYDFEVDDDHTYTVNGVTVSNSVCGYDSYAISRGFPYEDPKQAFFMIHHKFGKIMDTPIILKEDV